MLLLTALAVVAVVRRADFGTSHPGWALLSSLLYVGNWYRIAVGNSGLLNHTWSLAIEEQFYLLWPPVLVMALRRARSTRTIVVGVAAAIVLVIVWRIVLSTHASVNRIYAGSDTRADGLLFGCLLALCAVRPGMLTAGTKKVVGFATVVAVAAFLLGLLYRSASPLTLDHGVSIAPEICVVIVGGTVTGAIPLLIRLLEWSPVAWIGTRSYGIYLWHAPAIALAVLWIGPGLPIRACAAIVGVAIAALSYRYVERPFLRQKLRFDRARSVPAGQPGL